MRLGHPLFLDCLRRKNYAMFLQLPIACYTSHSIESKDNEINLDVNLDVNTELFKEVL